MPSQGSKPLIGCEVMKREGGRLLFSNKGGFINYIGRGHAYSFFFELAVHPSGILISLPKELAALSAVDRQIVLSELDVWLAGLGLAPERADILEEEDQPALCQWKGCGRQRLKGRYICRYHYDENDRVVAKLLRYVDTSRTNAG